MLRSICVALAVVAVATATVHFEETFDDETWEDRWVVSSSYVP